MDEIQKLKDIVKKLRAPDGCPWDRQQNLYSMKAAMLEEAAELADALDNKDIDNIKEELGDLLLHVAMHSQMASEGGLFDMESVAKGINDKLIRRHPHVFGDEKISESDAVIERWQEIKKEEQKGKPELESILDKAPKNLTTLSRAQKLQKLAAKVGFDWADINDVFKKLDEELNELKTAIANGDKDEISDELGDMLFVMANIARHTKTDADEALRGTNRKFVKRFNYIEKTLSENGKDIKDASLDEMESLWQEAKKQA